MAMDGLTRTAVFSDQPSPAQLGSFDTTETLARDAPPGKNRMTIDVENKILKQVEFYFGDANLPRDKFLLERVQENEDGCIFERHFDDFHI